jgi:anti-sigma regulatory factor (Ser/Thr protein kinase)
MSLAPKPTAASVARRFVGDLLRRWEIAGPLDTAILLTSETVTNAALHAATGITLTVAVAEGTLEVGVADHDPRRPRPRRGGETYLRFTESGRGLQIVDALADEWGVQELSTGKQVWFRVAVDSTWPYLTACACGGRNLHRAVVLGSGRRALALPGPWS